jgi:hypothetical protein
MFFNADIQRTISGHQGKRICGNEVMLPCLSSSACASVIGWLVNGILCRAPGAPGRRAAWSCRIYRVRRARGEHSQRAGRFRPELAAEPEEASEGFSAEAPRFVIREM